MAARHRQTRDPAITPAVDDSDPPEGPVRSRGPAAVRRIAGRVLLCTAVGLVAAELALRILPIQLNLTFAWRFHPVLGWSQVPGGRFEYDADDGERVAVAFNREGFHDVDHDLAKPAGVRRVVLIGDSFSEALQVNLEQTFFRILEARLNAAGPHRWEVINLGVGDFGTTQACLALEEIGLRYAPDVVLCQVFPLNDVCNNTLALCGLCQSRNDRFRPYFVPSGDGMVLTSAQPLRNWLRRNVLTYRVLDAVAYKVEKNFGADPADASSAAYQSRLAALGLPDGLPEMPLMLYTFVEDAGGVAPIAAGWRVTERILARIVGTCTSRGIHVLPVVIPWHHRVGRAWPTFQGWHAIAMVQDYPERRLGAHFERLGVPSLMLKDVFEQHEDAVTPPRDGHLNPAAHRLTAEAIHARMTALGWLD